MKLSIKFHPLLFQSSLAAGGVSLMAFNYLQFAIPHGEGQRWPGFVGQLPGVLR
jgi:hypothetical protein